MRLRMSGFAMLALAAAITIHAGQKSDSAKMMLEAAKKKELVDGDLNGAIQQYKAIVDKFKDDRALAAEALIRIADCYQKLGDLASDKIYEQIVREYPDQKKAVAVASTKLARKMAPQGGDLVTRRIWTMPPHGQMFGGTVSPDGRYIPYIDWAPEHHGDLFLHDLKTGTDRRLTNTAGPGSPSPDDQFAEEASFSRDGRRLAYTWFDGKKDRYELRIIALEGTGIPPFHRVFDSEDIFWIAPFDWSPDGKSIAVSLHRRDRTAQIGLVGVQSGSLQVLKSIDWRGPSRMSFSADGRWLAYDLPASDSAEQRDIFVLAKDGSREAAGVVHPSNETLIGWSQDGKRLLFESDRAGTAGLWALDFVGGNPSGNPEPIIRDIGQRSVVGISASGMLYSSAFDWGSDIRIASLDLTTGQFLRPPATAVQTFVGNNRFPDWSPDGKELAYISFRGGDRVVIGIKSLETGATRELFPPLMGLHIGGVQWSPDGHALLAVAQDTKGRNGIFRIDAQTGEASAIVVRDRAGITSLMPSPNQTYLYYLINGPSASLVKRDLISGNETELARLPSALSGMYLSPDGRYIAATTTDPLTKAGILVSISTANGEVKELVRRTAPERPFIYTWAPDSRSMLARMVTREDNFEIWRISLNGDQPSKLEARLDRNIGSVRLHPDGRQVAFQVNQQPKPTEVWVTEHFIAAAQAGK